MAVSRAPAVRWLTRYRHLFELPHVALWVSEVPLLEVLFRQLRVGLRLHVSLVVQVDDVELLGLLQVDVPLVERQLNSGLLQQVVSILRQPRTI